MTQSQQENAPPRASWYQRMFAGAMAAERDVREDDYDARTRTLLGDLHGDVLEVGPGTGPNLAYYASDVRWFGVEPNPAMFPYLHEEAERLGMAVDLREGRAEHLDAPDDTYDAVVSTLVLCSVRDQTQVLREILRVLKPGGRFVFIEHVAAPRTSVLRTVQRLVRPFWSVLSDGCKPDRETWATIEHAGFSTVQLEHFRLNITFVSPHIAGYAVK